MKVVLLLSVTVLCTVLAKPPNIVIILADDLGWNDVGFHGSNQIPTPNIDALAYDGVILNNYYVSPICSPSRSALMTGKHPIHTGMQNGVIMGNEPYGLPLKEKILPQYLKELGYSTHLIGKWHLGFFKKEYTPTYRGFDSFVGHWLGRGDYHDHMTLVDTAWGYDWHRNDTADWNAQGRYVTDLIADEAIATIKSQSSLSAPLFMMLSNTAVHAGNSYRIFEPPLDLLDAFPSIENVERRGFAGMLTRMDDAVGSVVTALEEAGILNNTIILFSTDNGGATHGYDGNVASNFPLRGSKNTLWEGGVRGAAAIWSPLISNSKRVSKDLIHIQDWLPTFVSAAGGNGSGIDGIDGFDMWSSLTTGTPSPRQELLHNIDDSQSIASVRVGDWKLIKGQQHGGWYDKWYGDQGRDGEYDVSIVVNSPIAQALNKIGRHFDNDTYVNLRSTATTICKGEGVSCSLAFKKTCLFNIAEDPCEENNLASEMPEKVQEMENVIERYRESAVPPENKPAEAISNPRYWNYVWTSWRDFPEPHIGPDC